MSEKGREITNVFNYAQGVLFQLQRIMFNLDNIMDSEWEPFHDDVTVLSTELNEAENWLVRNLVRMYEKPETPGILKGINIILFGENITEPVITASKIEFTPDEYEPDLWLPYYTWTGTKIEPDGSVQEFFDTNFKISIFAHPLTSIENEQELIDKIVIPLTNL